MGSLECQDIQNGVISKGVKMLKMQNVEKYSKKYMGPFVGVFNIQYFNAEKLVFVFVEKLFGVVFNVYYFN